MDLNELNDGFQPNAANQAGGFAADAVGRGELA